MRKTAFTLAELLIAMSVMGILGLIAINTLPIFIKEDSDLIKYKQVLGTVSEVVYRLKNDDAMYPNMSGFADISEGHYVGETKTYSGPSKFRKLFKSKFNVFEDNIKFNDSNIGNVPAFEYYNEGDKKDIRVQSVDFSELHCYTDNKSITYCLPDTVGGILNALYIRVYLNSINPDDKTTYDNSRAIYFKILKTGKIMVPPIIPSADGNIIDCTKIANVTEEDLKTGLASTVNKAGIHAAYAHCRVRDRSTSSDVHELRKNREKRVEIPESGS